MSTLGACNRTFALYLLLADLLDDLSQKQGLPCVMRAYELFARCVSANPLLKLTSTEEDCTACACYSVIYKLYNREVLHPRDIAELVVKSRAIVVGHYWLNLVAKPKASDEERRAIGFSKMIAHRELTVLATAKGKLFPNGIVMGSEVDFEASWRTCKFYELWQFDQTPCDSPRSTEMTDLNIKFYWHVHLYQWVKALNFFFFGQTCVFVLGVEDNSNNLAPEMFAHWKSWAAKHPFVMSCLSVICVDLYGKRPNYSDAQMERLALEEGEYKCSAQQLHAELQAFKALLDTAMDRSCESVLEKLSVVVSGLDQLKLQGPGEVKHTDDSASRPQLMADFSRLIRNKDFFVKAWNVLNSMGHSHKGVAFLESFNALFDSVMDKVCVWMLDQLSVVIRRMKRTKTLRSGEIKHNDDAALKEQLMSDFFDVITSNEMFVTSWRNLNTTGYASKGAAFRTHVNKLHYDKFCIDNDFKRRLL